MKVYVAASLKEADRARVFASAVVNRGHSIAFAWWNGPIAPTGDEGLTGAQRSRVAIDCMRGVEDCDVLILLLSDHPQRGSHAEFGMATQMDGDPLRVVVGSPEQRTRCAMYALADGQLDNEDQALVWIGWA